MARLAAGELLAVVLVSEAQQQVLLAQELERQLAGQEQQVLAVVLLEQPE
jgi:hypothetical protein